MRPEENEGRPGKQSDGFSKTRELKLVTLWAAESLDPQGWPTRTPGRSPIRQLLKVSRPSHRSRAVGVLRRVGCEAEGRGFEGGSVRSCWATALPGSETSRVKSSPRRFRSSTCATRGRNSGRLPGRSMRVTSHGLRCHHHHCPALLLSDQRFRGLVGASVGQRVI